MDVNLKSTGWNWTSFIFGPFWYFKKKMNVKGFWLLLISVFTGFFAAPFVWVYCGFRGNRDLYNFRLKARSEINLDEL